MQLTAVPSAARRRTRLFFDCGAQSRWTLANCGRAIAHRPPQIASQAVYQAQPSDAVVLQTALGRHVVAAVGADPGWSINSGEDQSWRLGIGQWSGVDRPQLAGVHQEVTFARRMSGIQINVPAIYPNALPPNITPSSSPGTFELPNIAAYAYQDVYVQSVS